MHEVQQTKSSVGRYVAATSLEQCLELLTEHGDRARVIAGGTDLLIELDRGVQPDIDVLVDLTRIPGLTSIHQEPSLVVHLGPLVTHNQCATDPLIRRAALPLAQASLEVGSPALRNRATIAGNLVTASPANDTISALVALDASVTLASARGQRTVSVSEFHLGVRRSVLAADELLTGISVPAMAANERGVFVKLGLRAAQAISVVHLAVVLGFEDGPRSRIVSARIALGSVAPTIVRAVNAEQVLVGERLEAATIASAAGAAAAGVTPIDDLRAPAAYRSDAIETMLRRAFSAIGRSEERAGFPEAIPVLGGPTVSVSSSRASSSASSLGLGREVSATVNGSTVSAPWVDATLLDWLRESAGLIGSKEGCAEGECGACTAHLDGTAVLSCLVPSGRADGATVVTIEGLGGTDGVLDPLQQRFIDAAAVQCGYCIPGFLMAGAKLREEGFGSGNVDDEALRLGLSGNLCRCTGYYKIGDAFAEATNGIVS